MVVSEPGNREFAFDSTTLGQEMRQDNPAVTEGYFIGTHPVEKSLCIRSSYLVL